MKLGKISEGMQHRDMFCELCGKRIENGFGHNAWPLLKGEGRCCDTCNRDKVLPHRIAQLHHPDMTTTEIQREIRKGHFNKHVK
jgi:hypothetical protein